MADEESEIRRMAEIADAINAILDADPVGDTPTDTPDNAPSAPKAEPATETITEIMPDAADADTDADTETGSDAMADLDTSDLDAAIAAELHGDTTANTAADADDHFGPAPVIDFDAPVTPNDEIGRDVKDGSQMADLSLRMQDTLAEIRAGHLAHTEGRSELITQMEAARDEMMAEIRGKVDQLTADTQSRKQAIIEQIDQIEQQNMMFRDEVNIKLLQFEDQLKQLQTQYFESSASDRDRLDRYREFLQYLLSERGL